MSELHKLLSEWRAFMVERDFGTEQPGYNDLAERTDKALDRFKGHVLVPKVPTFEMQEAAAGTDGCKAVDSVIILHQIRLGRNAVAIPGVGSTPETSVIRQIYDAMVNQALEDQQ
jgi:hypothetical protein